MGKRQRKPRSKVLDALGYAAARFVVALLQVGPVAWSYFWARVGAWLAFRVSPRVLTRSAEHLRRSFPDWPEDRVQAVARLAVRSFLQMALEITWTPRLIRPDRWRRHVHCHELSEALRLLTRRDGPVILVTGHVGNWEIAGYTMACVGYPTYTVARAIENPYLNEWIFGVRERAGQHMIYKKGAAGGVTRALDAGEAVVFVGDQDAGRKGVFVDFFGRRASTYKSIALMAIRYRAPVLVVGCRRLGERFAFEICVPRIIRPEEWESRDKPMHWLTQEYTSELERMVRRCPEQYAWMHRRWKHRPQGEPPAPGGIA